MKRKKLPTFELEGLPDEVLLKVLSFLELPDLTRCEQVSKRLKSIVQIESLWQKLICFNNNDKIDMSINFVEKILSRGCKTLSLKRYRLTGDAYMTRSKSLVEEKLGSSKLINLNLYQCELPNGFSEKLMSSIQNLKKLSLTQFNIYRISNGILSNFYSLNGQTLQTLNLAFSCGIKLENFQLIVNNCTRLKEIELSGCCQSEACTSLLVNSITKSIEKFGLGFTGKYDSDSADGYITTLVSRCKKIKSLNLGYRFVQNLNFILGINWVQL